MTITTEQFWLEVSKIGWGTKKVDTSCVQKKLALQWGPEKSEEFYKLFRAQQNKLSKAIDTWENENDKRVDCSDDGFGDLTAHIVGLGEAEFNAAMANPKLAYDRASRNDYQESFSYLVPNGNLLSAFTESLPAWRDSILRDADRVRSILPAAIPLLTEVLSMVENAGSLDMTNKEIRGRHQQIAKLAEGCHYCGPLADLPKVQEALEFFHKWSYVNYITDLQDWAKARMVALAGE